MGQLDAFRYYTEWHDHVNRQLYDAPADPWTVIRVDPADVEYLKVIRVFWGLGRVRGGEWDRTDNLTPVRDIPQYRGFRQRFEDGADWEETAYYEMAEELLAQRGQFRGCEDIEEFRATRCERVDDLYESMLEEGYRPNYERIYDTPEDVEYIHDLEPLVLVGRSGDVYWSEGFTRLVLAKILDIDEIPVYVLRRHERWQRIRDGILATPGPHLPSDLEAHARHPDIAGGSSR